MFAVYIDLIQQLSRVKQVSSVLVELIPPYYNWVCPQVAEKGEYTLQLDCKRDLTKIDNRFRITLKTSINVMLLKSAVP